MKKAIFFSILLLLHVLYPIDSNAHRTINPPQKKFIGKFVGAGVLEGEGSYIFANSRGKIRSFAFHNYYEQNLPYNFFDDLTNTNDKYINCWFEIIYERYRGTMGDSEEIVSLNRIIKIKLINCDK